MTTRVLTQFLGILTLASVFLVGCKETGVEPNESPVEYIALVDGNIVDGTGAPVQNRLTVLIRDGKIEALGADVQIPEGAKVFDVQGKTILPGLIDVHGHLYANTGGQIENQFQTYPKLFLAGGVTTIFSPGEFDPVGAVNLRDGIERGELPGPHILTAGPYFDGAPSRIPWIVGVSSATEAIQKFENWRDRIDGVKLYTSITEAQMSALIETAHSNGLFVTGHLESISATRASEFGIDGLEHGIFAISELGLPGQNFWERACVLADLDLTSPAVDSLITKIVEQDVYIDPTTVQYHQLLPEAEPVVENWDVYLSPGIQATYQAFLRNIPPSGSRLACLRSAIEKQKQFVKAVHDRGGRVVVGTDPVLLNLTPGYALYKEMQILVEAGLTELEVIKAATYSAAVALGRGDQIGSIAAGKHADLIVVDGNPADDIGNVAAVVMVFKDGKAYDPVSLRKEVEGQIGASF